MYRKIAVIFSTLFLAFAVLSVSVLRAATTRYAFSPMVLSETAQQKVVTIQYSLPYPGKILPDHSLWYLKALRDKLWMGVTINKDKKAELLLLYADKRLWMSKMLFEKGKSDLAYATYVKAEMYLWEAASVKTEDPELLKKIATAALKHREFIENEILPISPEDAKPGIIKDKEYSIKSYEKVRDTLLSKGVVPPENPFDSVQ